MISEAAQLRADARAALAVQSLGWFTRQAWRVIEPGTDLLWNWHHELICRELEAVARGEVRELVVNIPPGFMKSILVSVMFPAWLWLRRPTERLLAISNDAKLSVRDGRKMREIIRSSWYQALVHLAARHYGHEPWGLAPDQNEKTYFETTARGFRQNLGIRAAVTGKRGDGIIIDDPYDAKSALLGSVDSVAARMAEVCTVYDDVLASRLNDRHTGYRIVIMQRLHPDDLAGHLLRRGVRHVVLPMEYDPDLSIPGPDGPIRLAHPEDPRTEPGELLHPARYNEDDLAVDRVAMGAMARAAQHGQRPTPASGALFQRSWFGREYRGDPLEQRRALTEIGISVDCNFRETKSGSYAVAQVWGRVQRRRFLILDQWRARAKYTDLRDAVRRLIAKWRPRFVLIEAKALGDALIADLQQMGAELGVAVIPYDPGARSKYERAQVGSVPAFEAGQVELPAPEWAPWIGDYVEEHVAFPLVSHDDQVDATSQILTRWTSARDMDALERTRRLSAAWLG